MNISYIFFIWPCFCPMSNTIVNSFILCLHNDEQFREKVYNFFFFAHATIMDLLAVFSWLSIGWPFQQAFSVTSIRWHYGLYIQYALICFPFCHIVQALNLMVINLIMQCACCFTLCGFIITVLSQKVHDPSIDIKSRFSLGTVKNENVLYYFMYVCMFVCMYVYIRLVIY